MTIQGPDNYRIPNTTPMIHTPAIPRTLSDVEYRAVLLDMLASVHALGSENDPAYSFPIFQLEEVVIEAGLTLPIVRRVDNDQPTE